MHARSTSLTLVTILGFVLAACANGAETVEGRSEPIPPALVDPNNPEGGTTIGPDGAPEPSAPHALGTVVLGEAHASTDGVSSPIVSVSFVPDAKILKECPRKIGSCEVTQIPKCTTGAANGCPTGETCVFDDACQPKCLKACTRSCGAGEECYFGATGSDMQCRKVTSFDAGAIAFGGLTTSLTLFPPYSVRPTGNGAPFMPGSEIRVMATGAKEAGFEGFDEKFTATTLLEATPPLRKLTRAAVFGSGALTIAWAKGSSSVVVTATGAGGTATCRADDAAGKLELPREVISAAMGDPPTGSLALSVTRERVELRKGKKTIGSLPGQVVQPTGWLQLTTRSTETHSLQPCPSGTTECSENCVNVQSDTKHCGTCGNACNPGFSCSSGTCR